MSEQFNKDYNDYFSALQKSIEKQNCPPKKDLEEKSAEPQKAQKTQNKKAKQAFFGKVLKIRPWVYVTSVILVVIIILIIALPKKEGNLPSLTNGSNNSTIKNAENTVSDVEKDNQITVNNYAKFTDSTQQIASDIESGSIIVINCNTNEVVAAREAKTRCYPASTTKIMTILTACDYIEDNKSFTYSFEVTDPFFEQGATMAGFSDGETVSMIDMLYGAILPSGADATQGLAMSIAGSEEEFVKLMNKKARDLGLKNTNFTNASGLFNSNHYTTAEDMAVIVRAAMNNDLCKKILSTYQYTTASTPQHPEGINLTSTLFSKMYGTEPEGADILGGKTGYVSESGHCIASFGKSESAEGTEYVCVTFKGTGGYPVVYDQIKLYTRYAK